jgi:hypothetical protein
MSVSDQLTPGLVHTPFLIGLPNILEDHWRKFLAAIGTAVDNAPSIPVTVPLTVTGAVGVTPLPLTSVRTGMYRITVYTRISVPASVTSSLIVTIGWTDDGVNCSKALSDNNGNTTDSTTNDTLPIHVDGGTAITYGVTYASNVAGMIGNVVIVVEELGA